MSELKPCPFCGKEAWGCFGPNDPDEFPAYGTMCWIECTGNECPNFYFGETREECTEAWNARAAAPPADEHRVLKCRVCGHTAETTGIGAVYCGPHGDPAHIPAARMLPVEEPKPADELARLEREIATDQATQKVIGFRNDYPEYEWNGYLFRKQGAEFWPRLEYYLSYFELRGLLERHPDNPNLVRIKERGDE